MAVLDGARLGRSLTMPASLPPILRSDTFLAWLFVITWGSGYLASKIGLASAPPFTFLTLRLTLGMLVLLPWLLISPPRWPASWKSLMHICVAGLLMHAVNLSGSHYAQYLGMSAGITALLLATQPLLTAGFASWKMGERLGPPQWLGIFLGLAGVTLVVWHKVDVREASIASLIAVAISLLAITSGTLYQRVFCPNVDLRSASFCQFGISVLLLIPLAWSVEGFAVDWRWQLPAALLFLVVFGSLIATNILHYLMRRGQAAKVTSLLFLTPIVAVILEWALFQVSPSALAMAGIAITCAGVALVTVRRTR